MNPAVVTKASGRKVDCEDIKQKTVLLYPPKSNLISLTFSIVELVSKDSGCKPFVVMNSLLTCIEDATLTPQSQRSQGISSSIINHQQYYQERYSRDEVIEKFLHENKELRKKVKQMNNKIFQIESDRCAERIEYQKQIEAQNNSYSAEMFQMNSHRLIEISQMKVN